MRYLEYCFLPGIPEIINIVSSQANALYEEVIFYIGQQFIAG